MTRLVGQTGLRLAAAKGPNGWVILPGQGARHRLAYNERLCHRLPVAYNDRRKISSSSSGVSTIGFPFMLDAFLAFSAITGRCSAVTP